MRNLATATLAVLILWACGTEVRVPSATGAHDESTPTTQIPTAPPPILYPPHDPSATYPVIRTWEEVLTFQPYAYLKPLPGSAATSVDGVYAKVDPRQPQWWRCARCADFMLAGGNWRLMLHQGIMRMYYEVSGFSTVSSYSVEGDRIELFNDPHCPYEVGEYAWKYEGRALVLTEVQDTCAIHLRAENLTHQPWVSCQPPNNEAAVTDHWIRPGGC